MNAPLLACGGLTMRFDGLVALDGLDIEIDKGETVGLVGPNGSGKTTFLQCGDRALQAIGRIGAPGCARSVRQAAANDRQGRRRANLPALAADVGPKRL
ncbi:ABC-type branched-subunit amino acid transport system ATPase component [Bradyrhizobium sp. AZCC 1678]|uniref:ATP-binding cassette domain-containing protein n=1 Tax=Bradyrhizobium sp. AZCC 1678 TaxID=3117030 RepID=UPI002FF3E551